MPVNFNSALMRSNAIASLDHASFRVYFVLSQHCVELRSTRIAAPSFTQLHSAIAPECGGISIGMFRKSLLSLESAGFMKIGTQGRVKIFDLLGVRESYPDVAWFDRAVLILEESADASSAPLPLGEGNQRGEGQVGACACSSTACNQETQEGGLMCPPINPGARCAPTPDNGPDCQSGDWRSQGNGSSSADGNADVIGSSSDSSALQAPDAGLVGVIQELPSSPDPNSSIPQNPEPVERIINPHLALHRRGEGGSSMSAAPSASCPAQPSGGATRKSLPVAEQKALLDDLRKRTAAVLARVHRDFPQSRPVRWGSQDPSSPFDEQDADAPGSASDGV
ncbi:MAG: hypothetical protein WC712_14685 [Candidatus Brocadiia bacterium]